MLRIGLFFLTNIAVMLLVTTVMYVFGVEHYLAQNGLNLTSLAIFCGLFGMGGSFVSLLISKWVAKKTMGLQMITEPRNSREMWLLQTVERHARQAEIGMPEVAIIPMQEANAFATGWNKNDSLVAVSEGLLHHMTQDEAEAVIGHEVAHIANGDMVTMGLIQGVMNAFVMFAARVVGYAIDQWMSRGQSNSRPGFGYYITVMVLEVVFGILAQIIVTAFSRWREYRADAGGAHLAGRRKMVAALQRLQSLHDQPSELPAQMAAFGIRGGIPSGLKALFMTHPPLEKRIAALNNAEQSSGIKRH